MSHIQLVFEAWGLVVSTTAGQVPSHRKACIFDWSRNVSRWRQNLCQHNTTKIRLIPERLTFHTPSTVLPQLHCFFFVSVTHHFGVVYVVVDNPFTVQGHIESHDDVQLAIFPQNNGSWSRMFFRYYTQRLNCAVIITNAAGIATKKKDTKCKGVNIWNIFICATG